MSDYLQIAILVLLSVLLLILLIRRKKSSDPGSLTAHTALARSEQQIESLITERDMWKDQLAKSQEEHLSVVRELENLRSYYEIHKEQALLQQTEVEKIRQQFNLEFQHLAQKILDEKTHKFTETNKLSLDQLLSPLREKLKSFEEKVDKSYKAEADERNVLKGVITQLMEQSRQISDEANNLTKALRGDNKKQGNWGEVILERVMERSGLRKDEEYRLQAHLVAEDGRRQQPDAIILLPDDKHLVVDSKVSLVAYERWVNSDDEVEREAYAKQHILSVENHVKSLSAKNYHELYQINSPDFVLLFMPVESAFSMSVTYKTDLFSDAWDRNVVIVSPSTLLATLRTIASMWKQERQNRNVQDIARQAGALYDKFVGFIEDMERVSSHLDHAKRWQDDALKKLSTGQGNLVRRVEKIKDLGAKTSKQISTKYLEEPL